MCIFIGFKIIGVILGLRNIEWIFIGKNCYYGIYSLMMGGNE